MSNAHQIVIQAVFAEHPFAEEILHRLRSRGHEAVLIGGVVRDGLQACWGRNVKFPPRDIDIACSALPEEVLRIFSDRPVIRVGEEFGVLKVVAPDRQVYEVATFRVESEYDGRWPAKVDLVRDLASDVKRRDLTINGLAVDAAGTVIDHVEGIQDLLDRRIRTIGSPEERFAEDYLRMLRAPRFACRVDGEIDPETADAIRNHSDRIVEISWERVGEEMLRLLESPNAARGIRLLDELGLLRHILPEVADCHGVEQPEEYHPEGDVLEHTIQAIGVADGFVTDPIVKLAILLHDIGKPVALERNEGRNMGGHCAIGARMARKVGKRLRLSRAQMQRLEYLVRHHMRIADFPKMGRGKQVRFMNDGASASGGGSLRAQYPLYFDLLQVLVADCQASIHRSSGWMPILRESLAVAAHIDQVGSLQEARALIDGHDLESLGMKPGPELGELLHHLHDRILAGRITTRDEALEAARASIQEANEN